MFKVVNEDIRKMSLCQFHFVLVSSLLTLNIWTYFTPYSRVYICCLQTGNIAWKVSISGVILVCISLHSDWIVSLRIQSECGKMQTRITPNVDTFHVVYFFLKLHHNTSDQVWINNIIIQTLRHSTLTDNFFSVQVVALH